MSVFEDKEYDIEEVKYLNFMSKYRGYSKPAIVRTIVYKHPESSYIVKKCPVYLKAKSIISNVKDDNKINRSKFKMTSKKSVFTKLDTIQYPLTVQHLKIEKQKPKITPVKRFSNEESEHLNIISSLNPIADAFNSTLAKNSKTETQRFITPTKYHMDDLIMIEDDDIEVVDEKCNQSKGIVNI
jgi:hypothetical protein